ncbi:MAG: 4-alpha-glucanotransferase, partial [Chloroflexi bacterium]|nr:4-alpha-glucanotransferase [Chloroflexota bacterium]
MVKALSPRRALLDLARSYGVQVTYQDVARQRRTAVSESLLAVLQALGAPVAGVKDAPAAYEERLLQQGRRVLPPTAVRWEGRGKPVPLRLPQGLSGAVRCTLLLESGEERRWDLTVGGTDGSVSLPGPLPFGYHRLQVEGGGQQGECLVIAAPERAYAPPQERAWGVFLPLYALHSRESWGAGDMGDLEALVRWTGVQGGSLVGVLPLLAAFLDAPYDPSPYAPASRLFWNEFYLDVRRLPELGQCSQARAMLESGAFQEETAALRSQPLVDYPRQMVLKRSVLQALAASLFAEESPRSQALWAYVKAHAELDTYARFRAALEQQGRPWRSWPVHLRTGRLKEGDYREEARRYHLYVQWAMEQQMEAVADAGQRCGTGLYLDMPLGVHPQGYDTWRWQDLFLEGVSIGAPPDALG